MNELLPVTAVIVGASGLLAFTTLVSSWTRSERVAIIVSFVVHILAMFAMVWISRAAYEGADMFAYHRSGVSIARYLRLDFDYVGPETLRFMLQQDDATLPVSTFGAGGSTASMIGVAAFLCYFLDDSFYAASLVFTFIAFFSKLALYQVGRESLAERYRVHMLVAILLLPSVVFWSAGLVKESLTVAGISLATAGGHRLIRKQWLLGALALFGGFALIAGSKAYFLFVFAIAFGIWVYWSNAVRPDEGFRFRVRPLHLLVGVVLAVVGVIMLGQLFPRYSFANLGPEVAFIQGVSQNVRGGGSSYEFGDPTATSLGGQLTFAPLGLLYALFRPVIFEATNLPMAMSAVEATLLTAAFVRVLVARGWLRTWRMLASSPFLVFSIVFALGIATAVGLSSTNLGSLVRYRMPLLPFYALALFVLGARPLPAESEEPAAEPPVRRAPARSS